MNDALQTLVERWRDNLSRGLTPIQILEASREFLDALPTSSMVCRVGCPRAECRGPAYFYRIGDERRVMCQRCGGCYELGEERVANPSEQMLRKLAWEDDLDAEWDDYFPDRGDY